ncbi:MAG TPA: helix-turn-helix domain-containing protein [Nitrososphaerales archaeon]|nr:helix-turn-helix domain-containing protein [Nitrososphaerales archaeon]
MTNQESHEGPRESSSLLDFGLTHVQVKVFVHLMSSDGLSTSEISKMIGVHRSDIYRALKRLIELGLIEMSVGSPSRYYTAEPTKAVRLLLESKRDELMHLESKTDSLIEWLETQRDAIQSQIPKKEEGPSAFRLVKGNAVIPRVLGGIQSARSEIIKVVSGPALRRHYLEFSDYEKEISSSGVTVRVLTEVNAGNARVAKSYAECVHLRHVAGLDSSLRYLVIDGMELLLAGTIDLKDEPDRSVLSTKNVVLVKGCMSYFEDLWRKSIKVDERLKLLMHPRESTRI